MTSNNRRSDGGRTRRAFLGSTAAIGALGLAGCSGGDGGAGDQSETATMTETEEMTPAETAAETEATPAAAPDVPVLNYALTLEHLEHAFYRDGIEEFSNDELMGADTLSRFGEAVRRDVPAYLRSIRDHEKAHVDALTATVEQLNGSAVAEAEYDFGYSTPSEFLGVAKALENTGVAAYAGAAPSVVNNDVFAAAAGIHSVEARHASFLNLLNDDVPFPAAVDEAKSMAEVFEIAGGFITSEVAAPEMGEDRPSPERKADDGTDDVAILNYALTLEHLEYAFYRDGLEEFGDSDLMDAETLSEFGESVRGKVPGHLALVRDHEKAHVDALSTTVEKLGGTPVEEAEYDFGYGNASEFLAVGKALENTGVAAYKGAAPSVSNDDILAAALGIHSVEARHAAFLNELDLTSPFPAAVDEPKTMNEVTEIAGQFITSN